MLTPFDAKCLGAFSGWLKGLDEEVRELAALLEREELPESSRRLGASALQYLLRLSALIPQGLEELGYLDVLFAFRILARAHVDALSDPASQTLEAAAVPPDAAFPEAAFPDADFPDADFPEGSFSAAGDAAPPSAFTEAAASESWPLSAILERLAADSALVAEFLADDHSPLVEAVSALSASAYEGKTAAEVVSDPELRAATVDRARSWAEHYQVPEFMSGQEELVKVRSFIRTRYRRAS
jgi:hypothetical protein